MMNTSSIQKKKQLLTPMKESSFKGFDITLFTTITVLGFYLRRYLIYYILIGQNSMFSLHFRIIRGVYVTKIYTVSFLMPKMYKFIFVT